MEEENVKKLGNAKYRAVEFTPCHPKDKACDHCAFELGKCRGAIWALGQCYVVSGDEVEKNIYYEEVRELAFA
jgi:hypothetical protein